MSLYMFDVIYSTDFLYSLLFMAVIIWLVLRSMFGAQSFWNALALAFVGMMFLPLILGAAQTMMAAVLLVAVGALLIQRLYCGASLTAAVAAMVVVLIVSSIMLPAFS